MGREVLKLFKIVGKEEKKYLVLDTTDGVSELVSGADLFKLKYMGVHIEGCTYSEKAIFTHIDETTHHSPSAVVDLNYELGRYFNELLDAHVILTITHADSKFKYYGHYRRLFMSAILRNYDHHSHFLLGLTYLAGGGKLLYDMSNPKHEKLLKKLDDIIKMGYQSFTYDEALKNEFIKLDYVMLKFIREYGVQEK